MERSEALAKLVQEIPKAQTAFIQLEVEFSVKELSFALEAEGFFVAELDRAPIVNKEMLMHALYQSCRFPAYFGFNWDALEDSLKDFSWIIAEAYVLIVRDFAVLKERSPDTAESFQAILNDVAKARYEAAKKPLKVLLLPTHH